MRFSDTTQFQIPSPSTYENSDSSPFNSDESISNEDSSQTFMTPSTTEDSSQTFMSPSTTVTPFNTPNQNLFQESTPFMKSNHNSLTPPTNDNSLYKNIINTPHTNIPSDRSRHPSQNKSDSLPPLIEKTTKTTYKLRHQPKLDYRLFIPLSKL